MQDEIKSRNSRVSSIIEICERLQDDYPEQSEKVPVTLASDLENRWHQTWINSVEIQCKLEERLKILQVSNSLLVRSFVWLHTLFIQLMKAFCLEKMLILY